MAKRHKIKHSRGRNYFLKRRTHHKASGLSGTMGVVIGGVAYGAGRQYVSNLIAPLTSKIPLGQYADNVGMGLLSWALATGKIPLLNKIPMSRDIGKAGLAIEAAFAGQELMGGGLSKSSSGVFVN